VQIPFPVKKTGEVLAVDAVNAAGKHQQATETFLRWLLTADAQAQLLKATGTGAGLATPVKRTEADLAASPMLAVYDAATKTAVPQIVMGFEDKTPVIRKIVIQQVVSALQGKTTMKEAMKEAQQQATEAVSG
jgi:multiple sugar transport system substrate-binding protein